MYLSRQPNWLTAAIPLDPSFLRAHGRKATEEELRRIVCSVSFELMERANAVRLLGPEMSYHQVDPYLPTALNQFEPGMALTDVLSYKSSRKSFDLYFEDSWTGYFIAARLGRDGRQDELLFIHLDDHTDMMPTLLARSGETLINPTTGATFDPKSATDWESAIYSGAVTIGNYITPFFYSSTNIHIRHINNSRESEGLHYISHEYCEYALIPDKQFASIGKSSSRKSATVGTYLSGSNPDAVLDGAPRVRTLVHIDLDYFINDFNGASRGGNYIPDSLLRTDAVRKINQFFHSLAELNLSIDRWLIATSPGFCSAFHWKWLLSEIVANIEQFEKAS